MDTNGQKDYDCRTNRLKALGDLYSAVRGYDSEYGNTMEKIADKKKANQRRQETVNRILDAIDRELAG